MGSGVTVATLLTCMPLNLHTPSATAVTASTQSEQSR